MRNHLSVIAIGASLVFIPIGSPRAAAQQPADSIDITIHAQLGSATQIIIPQTGSFSTMPPNPWPPHPGPGPHPNPRPVPPQPNAQPNVSIDAVAARVKILEQAATTTLELTLHNPSNQLAEAVLLLPVPEDAVVSAFETDMAGTGSRPTARILPRDEARRLYDAIVAKVRDPALLEFAGYNLIRSSTFPIAAGATQRVRLTYENLLPLDGNRIDYLLPRSESLERRNAWRVNVDVQNTNPISTVYSPSHAIGLKRLTPNHVVIDLDASAYTSPGPFRLSCLLESSDVSASLFAYPDPKIAPGGGYFLLMAGLPADPAKQISQVKREVTVVIDRSGSMAGAKMDQARAAALQVVEGLADGEAFNIIDYSTTVSTFAEKPVVKNQQTMLDARKYIENIRPGGGTNIHDALVEALRPQPTNGTLPLVLFLTDGLPTVGQTSEIAIRDSVEKGNVHHRRIFTFGVGNDVNVPLLDRLADITRASATYVQPQEDVEVKVSQVYKRLYGPIMSDLTLHIVDSSGKETTRLVRDLIPDRLPDLFEGDQLILLGQYQEETPVKFFLTGSYLGKQREFGFDFDFHAATTRNSFVPRLWASRRIAYLVDQIRQAGATAPGQPPIANASLFSDPRYKELADEILRLSTEFGILTEYTSFLATEGVPLVDNWRGMAAACNDNLETRAVRSRSGAAAVNQGMNYAKQKSQKELNYQNDYLDEKLNRVESAAVQQVCDRTFYRRGDRWIDARLINTESTSAGNGAADSNITPDETVEFGSERHLDIVRTLIAENRQALLSLDGDIIIQFEGKNILVLNHAPTAGAN